MAKNKQWKSIQVNWETLQDFSNDDIDYALYKLTPRQAAFCQAWLEFGNWQTRWVNLGEPMKDISEFVAQTSLNLMEENTIMIDCDDVELCLLTSPTIAAINAAIAQNSTDIGINQSAIQANSVDITNLTNRVTSAELSIIQNSSDISQNTADIVLQGVLINDNANNIIQNSADIVLQGVLINDNANSIITIDSEQVIQDNRLTALEAGGGGGGGSNIITSAYSFTAVGQVIGAAWVKIAVTDTLHQFTYSNALITLLIEGYNTASLGGGSSRINADGQAGILNGKSRTPVNNQMMSVSEVFSNLDTSAPVPLFAEMIHNVGGGSTVVEKNQNIIISIVEYSTAIPILNDPLVTFDVGGSPYTLPVGQVGIVDVGGNPDNCLLKTNIAITEYLEVEIDLGEVKTIDSAWFDRYVEQGVTVSWEILVDNVVKLSFSGIYAINTWSGVGGTISATTGQVIRLRMTATVANLGLRIDNFRVYTT